MRITPFLLSVLISGFALPFLVQLVKQLTKATGGLAFLLTCALTVIVSIIIVAVFSEIGLMNVAVVALVLFIIAHALYQPVVQRFFPNRGSL